MMQSTFQRLVLVCSLAALLAAQGQTGLCGDFEDLRAKAAQGDAEAQLELGIMYYTGQGAPQNYAEAAKCFRKAGEQGDAIAQCNLGVMYYEGQGVERDYVLSHMWLSLAEVQGDAMSAEYRELVSEKMTPYEIMESRKLLRAWKVSPP